MVRIEAAIAERAKSQLGLIRVDQLDAIGCNRDRRRHLRRVGRLVRRSGLVYAMGGLPSDPRRDVLAAVWTAGDRAVVSHRSAALLWGFHNVPAGAIDLTVPVERRPRVTGALVKRSTDLSAADCTYIGPIPVTTKVRTLIDLASVMEERQLRSVIDVAVRDGAIRRATLERRAGELCRPGRAGPGAVLRLLGADKRAGVRTESWLEREMLELIDRAGLPLPESQVEVAAGARRPRIDFRYVEQRLIVEVDGHRTHSTRAERQADAERDARLLASGWRVVRFTYEDVTERPAYVVAMLRELLACPHGHS